MFVYLELHSSGFYAAYSGNSVPTFRMNLSVPSSTLKKPKKNRQGFFQKRRDIITTLRCVKSRKIADLIHIAVEAWNQAWSAKLTDRTAEKYVSLKCDLTALQNNWK